MPGGFPGASLELPGGPSGHTLRRNWKLMKIFKDSGRLPERPGSPQGTQRDPKNRPQNVFLLKKGVPNVNFLRFLRAKPLFNLFARFFLFFSRKIDEKSMKKTIHVFTASLVFLNMATLTKHCIYDMKATSPFWVFLRFVSKKHQKNGSKIQATILPPKSTKK